MRSGPQKAAGIETWGSTAATVTDGRRLPQRELSRPTVVSVYVSATIGRDPRSADGRRAAGRRGPHARARRRPSCRWARWCVSGHSRSTIFRLPGVIDVPSVTLGRAASPTGTSNSSSAGAGSPTSTPAASSCARMSEPDRVTAPRRSPTTSRRASRGSPAGGATGPSPHRARPRPSTASSRPGSPEVQRAETRSGRSSR